MKRKIVITSVFLLLIFGLVQTAFGELIDRGSGLIYDTVLDVTWLQDANYSDTTGYDDMQYGSDYLGQLTYNDAENWADNLSYYDSVRNTVWNDWRLPGIKPTKPGGYDLTWNYDGSTDNGFNITSPNNELAHLYYVTLGNLGSTSPDGVRPQPGWVWGILETGPFMNLKNSYWSESDLINDSLYGYFVFSNGEQLFSDNATSSFKFAWAVRDGDVGDYSNPIPEPSTIILFSISLLGLAGVARRKS